MSLDTGNAPAETQAATESAVTTEPVVEQAASVQEAAPSAPSVDEKLQAIYDKHYPARSGDGKFTERDPVETPLEAAPDDTGLTVQPETKQIETAAPSIDPPASWTADMKAKWASLPPDAREYIASRESESHKAITQMGMKAKALEPFAHVAQKHSDFIQRFGLSPDQAYDNLLVAARQLQDNPAGFIAHIAKTHGVDLSRLTQEQDGQVAQPDPMLLEMRRELSELRQWKAEREREATHQRQQSVESEIEAFGKDKPYWDQLEEDLVIEVSALKQHNPNMAPRDLLQKAYDRAIHANPDTRARILEDQRRASEEKRKQEQEAKAKQARAASSVNVSTKASTTPAKPGSMDDSMRKVALKYGMRD